MNIFKLSFKIIVQILFVIIFISTSQAKNKDKFNDADYISDYFSGILLLNNNQYNESSKFFKKLNGLEESHINYSTNYLYSSINSSKTDLKETFATSSSNKFLNLVSLTGWSAAKRIFSIIALISSRSTDNPLLNYCKK